MNKKLRVGLLVLFLFLAIGFAAISTSLVINSSIRVGEAGDFDVYFSSAITDEGSTATISSNRQTITFQTKKLKNVTDTVVLDYTVTNDSYNYDANITVELVNEDGEGNPTLVHTDYYSILYEGFDPNESPVLLTGRSSKDGRITIRLDKSYIGEDFTNTFTLKLDVEAVQRTSLADSYTVSGVAKDDEDNILANTALVAFSSPQVFTTDSEGHYEITLQKGEHSVYYIPGVNESELRELGSAAKTDIRSKKVDILVTSAKDDENLVFNLDKTYNVGDIISIKDQKFYYLGEESNKIKLLSMYNLNIRTSTNNYVIGKLGVQHKYVRGSELEAGSLVTGDSDIDEDDLEDYDLYDAMGYGTVAWDSSNATYTSGTDIYGYVESYKSVLRDEYHLDVASARVPNKTEIAACFCRVIKERETHGWRLDRT